ncbi:myotubularin-related protein 9-like protein [Leptotrombidium deliense]|uniref:Myotubularin-related protein 9-like protein n=1 Tax=Leptotrombidium deliense TaxID=299467 RepID=A0A443S5K1_9ACAR|nr:myotubularin-related protein 9-like protein [Leptotrombidium deliense]
MEFAELIKTPKLDNIIVKQPFRPPTEGTLCITSHHLIFSSRRNVGDELWLLHSMVDVVERKITGNGGIVILKCKDFRIIQLEIDTNEEFNNVSNSIEWLSNLDEPRLLYPFFYRPMFEIVEDGWSAFCIEHEFSKIQLYSDSWRISQVNKNFTICQSYPESVIVPKSITDETITAIANFRCLGRSTKANKFSDLYKLHNQAVLLRSGQPMVGTNSKRCKEDEKLINTVLGSGKRGYIIETRNQNLAQLARTKGGGFEPEVHYPLWRRVHKHIDRHSTLLDSLSKLIEVCNDTLCPMDKWLSRLESCGWLSHIKDVLMCACLVAQCVDKEGRASVLVHGAEGMDSTLQVCSIAQVILDPDCRTVHGFEALIEREWLQAGHPFATRCKHSAYTTPSARTREQSPIFLVFLDCVYQIYNQFPCSFEFNEQFLCVLFEHAYASQFGTFLENCVKQRKELNFMKKTVSLWSYLNRPEVLAEYLNPAYEPNNSVIWPSVAPQSIIMWEGMYLRWTIDQSINDKISKTVEQLKTYQKELRSKAIRLRRQLLELAVINT